VNLLELQQDFRAWLTAESPGAARRLGANAAPGLAVYINNYRGQLMACLRASYPVLLAWLGEESFDRAAAAHVDGYPPRNWTLDAYALDFPLTVRSLFPKDAEVVELAVLERELGLAFVGPDAPSVDVHALGGIDWDQAIFDLVPTFSMHSLATNAAAIWSAINAGDRPPSAALLEAPADVAFWRYEFTPVFRTLSQLESIGLRMVRKGRNFGEICSKINEVLGPDEGLRMAGEFLAEWLRAGLIRAVRN
jgi:hypothetical protein